jgi:hypothetical protein
MWDSYIIGVVQVRVVVVSQIPRSRCEKEQLICDGILVRVSGRPPD